MTLHNKAWKGIQMCPRNKYIGAAKVRFENFQNGRDDTGLNGLKMYCVDRYSREAEYISLS